MADQRRFAFIGVTASKSAINEVFPRWAEVLELGEVTLVPVDLPVDVDPARYRDVVTEIAGHDDYRGALVTTHKVRILKTTRDLFASFDEYAGLLGEISCISKDATGLRGSAKDPVTSGLAMDAFLPRGYFGADGPEVLCFGAGGSGLAITVNLLTRANPADQPARVTLVNRSQARLDECARVLGELGIADRVRLISQADAERNDDLLASMPDGSLIVNATGMGKDRPGSPITDAAVFPRSAIVWEINYRGELDFLYQARAQRDARGLQVEDGWIYFIHGWSSVVAEVFGVTLTPDLIDRLSAAASSVR